MKYSFMSFSCPEASFEEMVDYANEFGYDGIEPRTQSAHGHGLEFDAPAGHKEKCRDYADRNGVDICCIATSCKYADPEQTQGMVEDTHQAIDLADDVGASRIRVFGGEIPTKVSRERAIELLVESMNKVKDHAGEKDIVVCMETHDSWCNPSHLAPVMDEVDSDYVGVNWDIMHPVRTGHASIEESFEILQPWIRHVHFHDGIEGEKGLDLKAIGKGEIDHKKAVEALMSMGYQDYLSGEWIGWEPPEVHLGRELGKMKKYEQACGQ
ncbi:MAG: sugar phosphate isomerase/epimerase family protein [Planctomycetota bacterium]